jgi:hypothetical protein
LISFLIHYYFWLVTCLHRFAWFCNIWKADLICLLVHYYFWLLLDPMWCLKACFQQFSLLDYGCFARLFISHFLFDIWLCTSLEYSHFGHLITSAFVSCLFSFHLLSVCIRHGAFGLQYLVIYFLDSPWMHMVGCFELLVPFFIACLISIYFLYTFGVEYLGLKYLVTS